jgi:isopentenyldiphosphate isomerase
MSNSELIDLVSEDDEFIVDTVDLNFVYENGLSNFRVVNALIINNKNQIWIPRRHPLKKRFPLALDTSVGGHVQSGESYYEAFIRESLEEVNLDPRMVLSKFLTKLTPQKDSVSAFMHIYTMHYNQEVSYNPLDFETFYWLTPEEILKRIEAGDKSKSDLTKIITTYLDL